MLSVIKSWTIHNIFDTTDRIQEIEEKKHSDSDEEKKHSDSDEEKKHSDSDEEKKHSDNWREETFWFRVLLTIHHNPVLDLSPGLLQNQCNGCHMWCRACLPFRSTWIHTGFSRGSCCSIFSVLCSILYIIDCPFVLFLWTLHSLSFLDLLLLITNLLSSNFSFP